MIAHELRLIWPDTLIELAIILLIAVVTRLLLHRLIKQVLARAAKTPEERRNLLRGKPKAAQVLSKAVAVDDPRQAARAKTLGSVLTSVADLVIVLVTIFSLLKAININIGPAIASVGIGGLAIGFGAQSLIKDVISGIFLIFEDQFGVGDYVNIDDLSGTVLSVQLRVTQIQDPSGQIWYIRNGEIITLGNVTQGWSSVVVNIPVNLDEDPFEVIDALEKVAAKVWQDPAEHEKLLEEPSVLGLTSFDTNQANYGVSLKCEGNQQWSVERAVRANALEEFRVAGIKAPSTPIQSIAVTPNVAVSPAEQPPAPPAAQQGNPKLADAYTTSRQPAIAKPAGWDEEENPAQPTDEQEQLG